MIYVIDTEATEKYLNLPIMISEITGDEIKRIPEYRLPKSDKIWHYYFLDRKSSIKPDSIIAYKWDNKIFQYNRLKNKMHIPEYDIYDNALKLILDLHNIKKKYKKFMITQEHGLFGREYLYGDESMNPVDVYKKYGHEKKLRVSKFIENSKSVSLHLIVCKNFFISPLVNQNIKNITLYRGGSYPSIKRDFFYDYCDIINKELMNDGYYGLAHIDFLVADNKIYFGEINPRIAGSTPYMCYTLEQEYGINMPYLEYEACLTGKIHNVENKKKYNVEWDFEIINKKAKWNTSHIDIRKAFEKSGEYIIPFGKEKHVKLLYKRNII